MSVFHISTPTKTQVVNSVERIVAVFLVAAYTVWTQHGQTFSKATGLAGIAAGATAVYSLVKSYLTTL